MSPPRSSTASAGIVAPQTSGWTGVQPGLMPAWSLSPTLPGTSPQASLCPPPWTSPEHCQKQPLRSLICAEQAEMRMLTLRPPSGGWTSLWLRAAREGPPGSGGHLGGPAEHVLGRWSCAPSRHPPETTPRVSSGPSTAPLVSPPPAQPENPSEDSKEVVLSVRSAGEPPIKVHGLPEQRAPDDRDADGQH